MIPQNEAVPAMKLMKLRIATGLGSLLVMATLSAVMLWATPVSAQELRHVAEVMKRDISGPFSFGPVSLVDPLCSATTGGPGCKFVTVVEGGTGKIVEGDDAGATFTFTQDSTFLFVLTPSGAHDLSGDPTGFCVPLFGHEHWVFEDGSTIELNRQGSVCCAASSCGLPRRLGPPFVTHESTIITGGTGRFVGLKGGGERASDASGGIGRLKKNRFGNCPPSPKIRDARRSARMPANNRRTIRCLTT